MAGAAQRRQVVAAGGEVVKRDNEYATLWRTFLTAVTPSASSRKRPGDALRRLARRLAVAGTAIASPVTLAPSAPRIELRRLGQR